MTDLKSERLTILTDPDTKEDIQLKAQTLGLSVGEMVRRAVDAFTRDLDAANQSAQIDAEDCEWISGQCELSPPVLETCRLLNKATKKQVESIHIRVRSEGAQVFYRQHGILNLESNLSDQSAREVCAFIFQCLAHSTDAIFDPKKAQRARIQAPALPQGLEFILVQTLPEIHGYSMILDMVYPPKISRLPDLGFSPASENMIRRMIGAGPGLNLIAGVTGSGRTTTGSAIMQMAATNDRRGVAIEPSPEYPIQGATRLGFDAHSGESFQAAIKAMMQLDPDVVFFSEIRDALTFEHAVRAAKDGAQVWATMHAGDALGALARIKDFDERASSDWRLVKGVIAQQLLPVLCPTCRKRLDQDHAKRFSAVCLPDFLYQKGEGCDCCQQLGFTGRIVVAETLIPDDEILEHVEANDLVAANQYWRNVQQGIPMTDDLRFKIRCGLIDPLVGEQYIGPL